MQPLTLDDLMPLDEYASRRREFFDAHQRYLDRYRRVRIGPRVTLLFENRQTLWFRLQEVLCIARLTEPDLVQQELNIYNRLLPGRGHLQAALLLEVPEEKPLSEELTIWKSLSGEEVRLRVDQARIPANLITCRPEDRCMGTAHWIQFTLDADDRQLLADRARAARCEINHPAYHHESLPLSDDMRQSLLEDLAMSDRDV
jgi:hypothetical protein